MPRTLLTGIATLALAMTGCFIVFASGAKQSPGRVAKKIRHSERSEESHRRTDGYTFLALVVGYFAALNMTYFFIRHSERSEESHRRTDGYMYFFTLVVGYFAIAQFNIKNQKNVAPL